MVSENHIGFLCSSSSGKHGNATASRKGLTSRNWYTGHETMDSVSFANLPRVSAEEVAFQRGAAWALGAIPWRAEVEIPPLGPVLLSYGGLAASEATLDHQIAFALTRAGRAGRLIIDATLAHALVAATLGSSQPRSVRRMSAGERGLIAGVVGTLLGKLDARFAISLTPPTQDPSGLPLVVDVVAAGISGQVRLEVPPRWFPHFARDHRWRARAGALTTGGHLELARTQLAAGALATLAPGDAVVFDAVPFAHATSPYAVSLVVGDYAASAQVTGGRVVLDGTFGLRRRGFTTTEMKGRRAMTSASIDTGTVLAAAPIEVVAEVGRVTLRGDEVLALAPGMVVALGAPVVPAVSLRVGNEVWAEGELVDIEGELGVRVTSLRRPLATSGR